MAPRSLFDQYASVPLWRKLGVKPGTVVGLRAAPRGIGRILGDLPTGVKLRRLGTKTAGLTFWFVRSKKELLDGIPRDRAGRRKGPIWILWPKRNSGGSTNLTQHLVRATGLAVGLVDYKICSIDATWSGLLFRTRIRRRLPSTSHGASARQSGQNLLGRAVAGLDRAMDRR